MGKEVLFLIRDTNEIIGSFVSFSSFLKHFTPSTKCKIHIFSLFDLSQEIKQEFLNLCGNNQINFQVINDEKIPTNRLNLLFYILQSFSFRGQVLYLNNNTLVISNIDNLFKNKKVPLLAKKNEEIFSIDTNVMVFNHKVWQPLFKKYPAQRKQISAETWGALMWPHTRSIDLEYNFPVSVFKTIINKEEIKIVYFDAKKPWVNPDIPFGHLWWKHLRGTAFYESVLLKNITPLKSPANLPKQLDMRQIIQKKPEKLYPLEKEFVKESFLYLGTFGDKAKKHKNNLLSLYKKIIEKANQ